MKNRLFSFERLEITSVYLLKLTWVVVNHLYSQFSFCKTDVLNFEIVLSLYLIASLFHISEHCRGLGDCSLIYLLKALYVHGTSLFPSF